MSVNLILFDLDGTLADSFDGIAASLRVSLSSFGIDAGSDENLRKYIGPPLRQSFKEYNGMTDCEAELATARYREHFLETGIDLYKFYPGVEDMLEKIRSSGIKMAIATTKAASCASLIVKPFIRHFAFVSGSKMDGTRSDKEELIRYALDNIPGADAKSSLMVGDRIHDILGAKACKMRSIGVQYGYGTKGELAGADFLCRSPIEVARLACELAEGRSI
jgi:phosphoglycolate phosphatase